MKAPAVVSILLGLGISDSRAVPRSGPFRVLVLSIFQQVTPEIVLDLTKSVSVKSVCSLRTGKGEDPPTRWPRVGRLEGSHIGRTTKALVRRSREKFVLVGWRRRLISCPRCAKKRTLSKRDLVDP